VQPSSLKNWGYTILFLEGGSQLKPIDKIGADMDRLWRILKWVLNNLRSWQIYHTKREEANYAVHRLAWAAVKHVMDVCMNWRNSHLYYGIVILE
jgi:hypothetical protein